MPVCLTPPPQSDLQLCPILLPQGTDLKQFILVSVIQVGVCSLALQFKDVGTNDLLLPLLGLLGHENQIHPSSNSPFSVSLEKEPQSPTLAGNLSWR